VLSRAPGNTVSGTTFFKKKMTRPDRATVPVWNNSTFWGALILLPKARYILCLCFYFFVSFSKALDSSFLKM